MTRSDPGTGRLGRLLGGLVCGLVVALGLAPSAATAAVAPAPVSAQASVSAQARAGVDCVTSEGEVATTSVLVVVAFPSGTFTRCVAPGGSGLDVLRAAGLAVEVYSYGGNLGGGVCGITDPNGTFVGCADGPDCLRCPASQAGSRYWAYYRCYAYSPVGAGSTAPAGGTIEAWRYGSGGSWGNSRPAKCDDGRSPTTTPTTAPPPPPAATSPPSSTPRGTTPSGSVPGGNDGGTTPPPGATGPGPADPVDGGAGSPSSTAPDAAATTDGPTTSTTTTTTAPETDGTGGDDDAPGDEDVAAGGEWVPAERTGGGTDDGVHVREDDGGGVPVGALAGAGGIVAVVGALAIRARRTRATTLDEPAG